MKKQTIIVLCAIATISTTIFLLNKPKEDKPREERTNQVSLSRDIPAQAATDNSIAEKMIQDNTRSKVNMQNVHLSDNFDTESGNFDTEEPNDTDIQYTHAKLQYRRHKAFEQTARTTLPLLSVQTFNPLLHADNTSQREAIAEDDRRREFLTDPPEGEIWIRIAPENSFEVDEIMARTADMFQQETRYDKPVSILLWVGHRPWKKYQHGQS